MTAFPDPDGRYASSWRFLEWMHTRLIEEARGDRNDAVATSPRSLYWLGRLAPEASVLNSPLGQRAGVLDPCAIGIRVRPAHPGPWTLHIEVSFRCWAQQPDKTFVKSVPIVIEFDVTIAADGSVSENGAAAIDQRLQALGLTDRHAEVRVDVESWRKDVELVINLVNTSDDDKSLPDTHLYESVLRVTGLDTVDFELEALPDSFRYDRSMPAIGINCGVDLLNGAYVTTDTITVDKHRPDYWNSPLQQPDLSFLAMSENPLPALDSIIGAIKDWGAIHWSDEALKSSGATWTAEMQKEADQARADFDAEVGRLEQGRQALLEDAHLLQAFKIASAAIRHSAGEKYTAWRPFQIGFLVSSLPGIVDPDDSAVVDTVWFATGGGKTETYLGLLVTAIIYDRLTGKEDGITAWTRFPLRSLSLQQTQRFADALAGAELQRLKHGISGAPISLGFYVGKSSTPNAISPKDDVTYDRAAAARYQVLLRCPFCRGDEIIMKWDRSRWTLNHVCTAVSCPWEGKPLPFHIVDQEIYRFLPTVIVGTLDKAASIAMQGAMRGFFAAPAGRCSKPGHGYSYIGRSKTPNGCLVPGCQESRLPLQMPDELFAPRLRLQDELHLLRDSLGAVDSHYESLLDHLQRETSGTRAKIVASSATLSGFERQIDVLYRRGARVFPQPGPTVDESFWTRPTETAARRYVAVAPRGVTVEYVADRVLNTLQQCVRELVADKAAVCGQLGIPLAHSDHLVSQYGVDLVYGNTRRDVEASRRSAETEFSFTPVNAETLTGGTPFEEVRRTLDRLENPETNFVDRVHLIAASSMISHGVDIDRLNVMVMKGLPLTTAQFIQTSARVGRRWPGVVYVLHRITREREVATYAQFRKFITQGDRFVEPIPVTRASRRVLALTTVGAEEARRLAIREYAARTGLATVKKLRDYYRDVGVNADTESEQLIDALGMDGPLDELLQRDIREWSTGYFNALNDPATQATWPSELSPSGQPMMSLRDVEDSVPVIGKD
jgi:hypothetical protein